MSTVDKLEGLESKEINLSFIPQIATEFHPLQRATHIHVAEIADGIAGVERVEIGWAGTELVLPTEERHHAGFPERLHRRPQ